MHAVIETSDSDFVQYWDKLCANDPVQNPIYMQQRSESQTTNDSITEFTDRSFLVMLAEEPVFGCSLTMHLDEQGRKCIGYFGREASSHVNQATMQAPSNSFRPEAIRLLQEHINQLIEEIQPDTIDYLDPVSCGVMSPITQVLLEKGAIPVVQQAQIIDLSISKRDLHRSMTKNCRGLVEWGRRNLELEIVSGDCFDVSLGDQVEKIYAGDKIAYDALIKKGNGFLVQGRYKGELVSNGLFVHNNKTCHLISAKKISNSIDRPVLHALIWEAMLQSRNMHCSQFDFGSSNIASSREPSSSGADFSATCFGGESHARLRVMLDRKLS
ncbi:MAG: hypothetical protein COB20_16310 [SAR86 cluster bacterium]|uniref:Uncharacterized protein n=1 Tax=SAR86 cluster bacterium TaxID=2030880 RepID=A0A2A4WU11_9GAMM|nr:MAG: hypothetical protein COB20_16310 [SAR86 cluster bacterium]